MCVCVCFVSSRSFPRHLSWHRRKWCVAKESRTALEHSSYVVASWLKFWIYHIVLCYPGRLEEDVEAADVEASPSQRVNEEDRFAVTKRRFAHKSFLTLSPRRLMRLMIVMWQSKIKQTMGRRTGAMQDAVGSCEFALISVEAFSNRVRPDRCEPDSGSKCIAARAKFSVVWGLCICAFFTHGSFYSLFHYIFFLVWDSRGTLGIAKG